MLRHLLNLLTALSLLLCCAAAVLWVRSYFAADSLQRCYVVDRERHGTLVGAEFNRGMARLWRFDLRFTLIPARPMDIRPLLDRGMPSWHSRRPRPPKSTAERWLLAFGYDDGTSSAAPGLLERLRAVVVPLWAIVAGFGAAPALLLRHGLRRRHRTRAGLCPMCGYDLRASPQRCPECGSAAEGAKA